MQADIGLWRKEKLAALEEREAEVAAHEARLQEQAAAIEVRHIPLATLLGTVCRFTPHRCPAGYAVRRWLVNQQAVLMSVPVLLRPQQGAVCKL